MRMKYNDVLMVATVLGKVTDLLKILAKVYSVDLQADLMTRKVIL